MRVYKHGKTWWLDYYVNGKNIRKSTHLTDRAAAEAGDSDGQYMLGWCIENHYGTEDAALEWYLQAAEAGSEEAAQAVERLEQEQAVTTDKAAAG